VAMAKNSRKLLATFKPESYDAEISIFPEDMSFKGKVKIIGIKSGPPSHRLTFNQQGLKVSKSSIARYNKQVVQSVTLDRINHHHRFGEVRLHANERLYGGQYTVTMEYSGILDENSKNLFLHSVKFNKKNFTDKQIKSYFSSKLLPCIDEPVPKAILNLTLIMPNSKVLISNKLNNKKY
jgi:aminopeptidase N